jgi:hypothetical protein
MSFSNGYETKILSNLFSGSPSAYPEGVSFGLLKKIVGSNPVEDGNLVEISASGGYARVLATGTPQYFSAETNAKVEAVEVYLNSLVGLAPSLSSVQRSEQQDIFDYLIKDLIENTPEIWQATNSYNSYTTHYSWNIPTSGSGQIQKRNAAFEWGASANYATIISQSAAEVSQFFAAVWDWVNNPGVSSSAFPNNTNTWTLNYNAGVLETVQNAVTIPFPDATGNWETADAFGVFENDSNALIVWSEFSSPISVLDGQKLVFDPNDLTIMLN